MQKSALVIASMASMLDNFNQNNIIELEKLGYRVDIAANFETEDCNSYEKVQMFRKKMMETGHKVIHIDFSRKLGNISKQILSIKQVRMLSKNNYDLVHCHSPICSVIVRIVFHNKKAKLIYTAHGFHFYKGAPLKNWLFYPVEKFLSRFTDVLITINKEDYQRAKKKFHANETYYIHGVGFDTYKFSNCVIDRAEKRKEIGLDDKAFLLLSVGELNDRKNHQIVIEALNILKDKSIFYIIVGTGINQTKYEKMISEYGLQNNIKLIGYRNDIDELCKSADCFVHPSIREGLGIAPLEAMASGLPLIAADINGIKDYAIDGVTGYCVDPRNVDQLCSAILKMKNDDDFRESCARNNIKIAQQFDKKISIAETRDIYLKAMS